MYAIRKKKVRDEEERRKGKEGGWSLAGLWLVVGPQIEFGRCNLTPASCNDSPGGRNDFLHWCYYCWSHHGFESAVSQGWAQRDGRKGWKLEEGDRVGTEI